MPQHRTLPLNQLHAAIVWVFANATARAAVAGLTSSDLYKLAFQSDDSSLWLLIAVAPAAWLQVNPAPPLATDSTPGFMSAADKTKLDGLSPVDPNALTYDLLFGVSGTLVANQVLGRVVLAKDINLPAYCAGSVGNAGVHPTSPASLLLKSNGTTQITITIGTDGTFSYSNSSVKNFSSGAVLTLVGPASPDTTLADVALTLVANLGVVIL